jgi:threonine synthase
MYFGQQFPPEYAVSPKHDLINTPYYVHPKDLQKVPAPGRPLEGEDLERFVARIAAEIAAKLELKKV